MTTVTGRNSKKTTNITTETFCWKKHGESLKTSMYNVYV